MWNDVIAERGGAGTERVLSSLGWNPAGTRLTGARAPKLLSPSFLVSKMGRKQYLPHKAVIRIKLSELIN